MSLKSQEFTDKLKYRGKEIKIYEKAHLINPQVMSIGDFSQIDDYTFLFGGKGISIGKRVHIAVFSSVIGGGEFISEDYSGLAAGCRIITGTDDFSGKTLANSCIPPEFKGTKLSFVKLGKFAILGTNCIVMPGVTIGEGVMVGAGSIITKNLEPWGIYLGTSPKRVKERDPKPILEMAEIMEKKYG